MCGTNVLKARQESQLSNPHGVLVSVIHFARWYQQHAALSLGKSGK
jgi:hypothetical protein